MVKFVPKQVVNTLTPAQAFAAQRQKEYGSARLREAVKGLLNEGKASTEVVGAVYELIVNRMEGTGRISAADTARVLPNFEQHSGW